MLMTSILLAQIVVAAQPAEVEGDLYIQLCSAQTYMNGPCEHQAVEPAAPLVEVTFDEVAPGDWALTVWRDPEGDGEMATRMFGIPAEPVAIYGDPRGFFGPPGFEAASIALDGSAQRLEISVD